MNNQQNQSKDDQIVPGFVEQNQSKVNQSQQQSKVKVQEHPFQLPESGFVWKDVEKSFLTQAIQKSKGNQSAAARLLGISRYALRYRLEKFGMDVRGNVKSAGSK